MSDREIAGHAAEAESERLGRAMRESNLVRWLVARAVDAEAKHTPTLWDPAVNADEIDAAWADVDRAMRKGGFR